MPEFDEYLQRIRAVLDVSPRRADEICAEVRTHLEERAAQLTESGMSRDEAVAMAAQGFGDPTEVARRLTQANQGHPRASGLRLVLSAAVAFMGMFGAWSLLDLHYVWRRAVCRWVGAVQAPWDIGLCVVIIALLMVPVLLVAGMAAGRRRWWLAGAPLALWAVALLAVASYERVPPRHYVIPAATAILIAAPMTAGFAFLGSRIRRRCVRHVVAWLGAGYLGLLVTAVLLGIAGEGEHRLLPYVAVAEWVLLLVPGTAALWQWGKPPRRAAILSTAACAVLLFALLHTLAGVPETVFLRSQLIWLLRGIVVVETGLALYLGAAVLARRRAVSREGEAIRAQ